VYQSRRIESELSGSFVGSDQIDLNCIAIIIIIATTRARRRRLPDLTGRKLMPLKGKFLMKCRGGARRS